MLLVTRDLPVADGVDDSPPVLGPSVGPLDPALLSLDHHDPVVAGVYELERFHVVVVPRAKPLLHGLEQALQAVVNATFRVGPGDVELELRSEDLGRQPQSGAGVRLRPEIPSLPAGVEPAHDLDALP